MKNTLTPIRIGKKKALEVINTSKGAMSVVAKTENNESRKFQFNAGTAKPDGIGNLIVKDRTIKDGNATRSFTIKNIKEIKGGGKFYKVS